MTDHDELLAVMQRCADHERTDPHTRYALIKGAEALRAALTTRPEPLSVESIVDAMGDVWMVPSRRVVAQRILAAAAGSATPQEGA